MIVFYQLLAGYNIAIFTLETQILTLFIIKNVYFSFGQLIVNIEI